MNFTRISNVSLSRSSTSIFHKKGNSTLPCGNPRQTDLEKRVLDRDSSNSVREEALHNFFERAGTGTFRQGGNDCRVPRRVKSTLNVQKRSSPYLSLLKSRLNKGSERVGGGLGVDLPSRKPCWKSQIQFRERLYQIRRPRITFSKSLARFEMRLMRVELSG